MPKRTLTRGLAGVAAASPRGRVELDAGPGTHPRRRQPSIGKRPTCFGTHRTHDGLIGLARDERPRGSAARLERDRSPPPPQPPSDTLSDHVPTIATLVRRHADARDVPAGTGEGGAEPA